MIDRDKVQLLANMNKLMLDASTKLEEAIKKRDEDAIKQFKVYLLEVQKKFDLALRG